MSLTLGGNERLTRVGAGTPGGELLRRYWHPIAASAQLPGHGTRAVTLLGESLVLYRDRQGRLGLIGDRCAHRRAGMIFGVPELDGLRCAYHGWLWNAEGRCLEQPYEQTEDPRSTLKDRVRVPAYPVQELGGLIFAYLGPAPVPLLPRWDLFVMDDVPREVGWAVIPCNWLQIAENSLDPVHVEWLHGYFASYVQERLGNTDRLGRRFGVHRLIGFSGFEHGIIKRRILEGETEEDEDWTVGHPHVFPNMLKSGSTAHPVFQIRVPMDDTNTLYFWYSCHRPRPGVELPPVDGIPVYEVPVPGLDPNRENQWGLLDNNSGQDMAMWFTQGPVADRTEEHLGLSDKGIALFRKQMELNLLRVQRGDDPMNVFRDPAQNVCIELPVEEAKLGGRAGQPSSGRRTGNASKYSAILAAAERQRVEVTSQNIWEN